MSKLTKLMKNPMKFIWDGLYNFYSRHVLLHQCCATTTFVIGFSGTWQSLLKKMYPNRTLIFMALNKTETKFNDELEKIITDTPGANFLIWGLNAPESILKFIISHKVKVDFIEDGFIRSVHLGSNKAPPRSWCFDSKRPYFDCSHPSDLELLLSTYDFQSDPTIIERSKRNIDAIINNNLSKYNNSLHVELETIYGRKNKPRILVIGQVENDASIAYGCIEPRTNNDLLSLAYQENPDAQIFYKEHPDVLSGNRKNKNNIVMPSSEYTLLEQDIPLSQALETIDHVYTITSLSGFEALLRNIKVTTLGCPFYSGWGLTDDRQPNPRRQRMLTKEELFAGAYILYPRYFCPNSGKPQTIEQTIQHILEEREAFYLSTEANTNSRMRNIIERISRTISKINTKKMVN